MIKNEELVEGLLVQWTAERYMRGWDCPCIVTEVNREKNYFKVFTFDEYVETGPLAIKRPANNDPSSLTEMKIISINEISTYVGNSAKELKNEITEHQNELNEMLEEYSKLSKIFDGLYKDAQKEINRLLKSIKKTTVINIK